MLLYFSNSKFASKLFIFSSNLKSRFDLVFNSKFKHIFLYVKRYKSKTFKFFFSSFLKKLSLLGFIYFFRQTVNDLFFMVAYNFFYLYFLITSSFALIDYMILRFNRFIC